MHTETVLVTPEKAKSWLANQAFNRGLSEPHVRNFMHILRSGKWVLDPSGIAFDTMGRLRNGQHRLTAVYKTGVSAEFRVHFNCTDAELEGVDQGRQRSAADAIRIMDNDPHARNKSAVIRLAVGLAVGSNTRLSVPLYREVSQKIGADHLAAICDIPRGTVAAPALLALVYARPVIPYSGYTERFLQKLRDRQTILTQEDSELFRIPTTHMGNCNRVLELMVGALGDKKTLHTDPRSASYKMMRGVQAFLEGECLHQLKPGKSGYEWLTQKRTSMGLPSLKDLVPSDLRGHFQRNILERIASDVVEELMEGPEDLPLV